VAKASVVVCTFDRPGLLAACLESLRSDPSAPGSWELLVIDNGGRDGTREVVSRFEGQLPLRLLREERVGKSFALNKAVGQARGDLLLFADDDVEVRPGWMGAFVEAARLAPEAGWFGGRSVPRWGPGVADWVERGVPDALRGYVCHYDLGPEPHLYDDAEPAPIGACMAVRASTFATIGGYDATLGPRGNDRGIGDDTELVLRARRSSIPGYWVPNAIVDHFVPAERLRPLAVYRYGRIKGAQQALLAGRRIGKGAALVRGAEQIARGLWQWAGGARGNALVCLLNAGLAQGAADSGQGS